MLVVTTYFVMSINLSASALVKVITSGNVSLDSQFEFEKNYLVIHNYSHPPPPPNFVLSSYLNLLFYFYFRSLFGV